MINMSTVGTDTASGPASAAESSIRWGDDITGSLGIASYITEFPLKYIFPEPFCQ